MLKLKSSARPEPNDLLDAKNAARLLGIGTTDLIALGLKTYRVPAQRLYRRGDLEAHPPAVFKRLDPSDSILEMQLTTRAWHALLWAGIETVGQLARCEPERLRRIPNIGHKSLAAIEQALAKAGYRLGECWEDSEGGGKRPTPETGGQAF